MASGDSLQTHYSCGVYGTEQHWPHSRPSNGPIDCSTAQKELLITPIIHFFGPMLGGTCMPFWIYHFPRVEIQ